MSKVVLETRKYKAGYEVRTEVNEYHFTAEQLSGSKDWETDVLIAALNSEGTVVIKSAYTSAGDYIGDKKMAHLLYTKKGIIPEKVHSSRNVCSIGFCKREQKWYGWSHRAIFGFGIGSVVEVDDCTNSSGYTEEYLEDHPDDDLSLPVGFTAKDLIDAKRMAIAFADSVG